MKRLAAIAVAAAVIPSAALPSAALAQGTWDAAEEYYGGEAMEEAKHALQEGSGGGTELFLQADRLEYRTNEGDPILLWDAQGWWGGDLDKLWVKSEGEYLTDGDEFEEAEIQLLYSRAVSPYFDLQGGVRYDFKPDPSVSHLVLGAQGLAPYWFEVDAAGFLSDEGDVTARLEAEYELLLTQRLILQPRTELNFALQDIDELEVGSGLSTAEAGLRLRYEVLREVAPYIGVSWVRKVGETADFARADGEDIESVSFVAGIRLWY